MLAQDTLNRVLDIYNEVVHEHRLTLDQLLHYVRLGAITPPEVLDDANQLLKMLFRYRYEQRAANFPMAPPAWAKRHTGFRWTIWEWPPAPSVRAWGARTIAVDPITEATLITIPQHEDVAYTGREIFNDFLALDLQCMPTSLYPNKTDKRLSRSSPATAPIFSPTRARIAPPMTGWITSRNSTGSIKPWPMPCDTWRSRWPHLLSSLLGMEVPPMILWTMR